MDVKRMRLRYAGTCARCGASLAAGTTADYDRASKTVACVACPIRQVPPGQADPPPPPAATEPTTVKVASGPATPPSSARESPVLEVVDGQGGASAVAEFQRRHDARQERVNSEFPRMGRFLLAVFDDPQSTKAWSVGAEGERILSEMLASIAGSSLRVCTTVASRARGSTASTGGRWCTHLVAVPALPRSSGQQSADAALRRSGGGPVGRLGRYRRAPSKHSLGVDKATLSR